MSGSSDFALFDGDRGDALLLDGYCRSFRLAVSGDHTPLFAAIEGELAAGRWVAMAADYALATSLEATAAALAGAGPVIRAWVFQRGDWLDAQAVNAFLAARVAFLPEAQRTAGVADLLPTVSSSRYADQVGQIRQWIADGDCYQINLTFPMRCRVYGDSLALYLRLRARQPVRYGAYLTIAGEKILSFSPELFFERRADQVQTRPMKGTAARGRTAAEDETRRAALVSSPKERAENVMIVDLLRNDLGRLAEPGKVHVLALCETEAYPTLWQMVSTVTAEVPGASLLDLFRALFPCGSITGAPKIRAMQRIAELEQEPRGLYTGALGWLAPGGDCRFNVAIRTLELGPTGHARMGVGSGIVADADAASEYAECLLKARFLIDSDPGFELFETLRLEAGRFPLLQFHLDRLQASAASLGFTCALPHVSAALAAAATSHPDGVFRVRLLLRHDGSHATNVSPLTDDAAAKRTAVFASEAVSADDYLLRHKTTLRSRCDRALAALADRPAVFDAIFCNERGEVCEGARSSVFVAHGGLLLTPPLSCGLLPGVLRRKLLESGRAVERVLRQTDLQRASALYLGNALRGLVAVTLTS
ncbi:aminodeoxychorismate synthase component I [Accumulibacter sp.]|uniref:aminodeoxychorismate synthase component I n=1 Tax=Accumulibacter sp. TaxID=2053492 RepID=UPI0025DAC829|nr:aminodeoxychorismate synthase component I [Accumulibacter sp.]MCM8613074.1 aminodeoxychorismate synthase component I [Accumulibacter sp.]MCM8636726.1 aminodeoxychorismate synthase component I [Accumulibacter sp.]MCM8640377.1 aminodeoxychorismate synthase component I [Accumulibacter sp.]